MKTKSSLLLIPLLLACFAVGLASARASTFTVINTNDSGAGSLRQAIIDGNGNPGVDTINFNIPAASDPNCDPTTNVCTITPAIFLPRIREALVIDGYTQPGASPNTNPVGSGLNTVLKIVIAGNHSLIQIGDLDLPVSGSTIRGLNIHGTEGGIVFNPGSNGNMVQGCFIGTDVTGTARGSGDTVGIGIGGPNNLIGGTTPAVRNLISGNVGAGVNFGLDIGLPGFNEDNNVIQGNLIGTNAAGTAAIPNSAGISVGENRVGNTLIGGTAPGARNVISGNSIHGINLAGNNLNQSTTGSTVQGNFIGTDVTGTVALGNGNTGVFISDSNWRNTIGGTTAGTGNVISANLQEGIRIITPQNVIQGNFIGTDVTGTVGLGGQPSAGIAVISPNNTIGGTFAGAANLVAFNGGPGVAVASNTAGVAIETNSIHDNGFFGIYTPTPWGDQDMFPPTLTSASISGGTLSVSGTHDGGTPNTTIRFEFFSNVACDPFGSGEGRTFLGFANVSADGSGNLAFGPLMFPGIPPGQTVITATATSTATNSTSAFSVCLTATGGPPAVLSAVSRKTHGNAGGFDVDLPLSGTAGIECRTGGGTNDYTMVATFSDNVTVTGSPQAEVTSGTGCVGAGGTCTGNVTINDNIVIVPLTNIANAQTINVRINGVNGSINATIPMSILIGDSNGNGVVNAADVSQTKSRLGQTPDATNFRSDVNANGVINAADVAIVKANLGNGLP